MVVTQSVEVPVVEASCCQPMDSLIQLCCVFGVKQFV